MDECAIFPRKSTFTTWLGSVDIFQYQRSRFSTSKSICLADTVGNMKYMKPYRSHMGEQTVYFLVYTWKKNGMFTLTNGAQWSNSLNCLQTFTVMTYFILTTCIICIMYNKYLLPAILNASTWTFEQTRAQKVLDSTWCCISEISAVTNKISH